ncbi:protease 3 precursor [Clostridium acetireducens DSM 10703]|uniref:Protease 3 n=1 Tax=Clostridium acetireducens DSM 10703 TaxID=1121290 RepID=A0A1E8F254_9CLOT|nr:pitrilysin family protein [Clostridium acetireducens]OFI07736.1 protease 3 precursor [Clostridium acetireducens DSM 10703]
MYNIIQLDNGLRIVLESIDYVNSISVGLWVENGSRNENKINNGISHFIEHMLFKGTKNRTAKDIVESIENVGGQINAFTGKESTCFYIKALNSHLELALDILSDMLFNSKFSEEDIEKEKGVIIEEINMSEDSPEDVLLDLHSIATWGEDSIALPILGTIKTVKSFTKNQILEYISSYYIPENSVLSICGNFDMKTIKSTIEKFFGMWSSNTKKITKYSSPKILNNNLFRKKSIEQLHISLGIEGFGLGNDDVYPLILLNNLLGGGASSILFQKIREDKGICYSIYSYLTAYNNTGIINIYTGLNPVYACEAINLIKEELEKFTKIHITDDKLIKSKEQIKGSYILGLESTSSRMFSNGKSVLFLNKINTPEDIIKKIDNITKNKLEEVMEKTFSKGILNSSFVGENVNLNLLSNSIGKDVIAFKNQQSKLI